MIATLFEVLDFTQDFNKTQLYIRAMSVDSQIKWDSQTVQTYSCNRSEHLCTTDSVVKLKDNNVMMYNENINIDSTLW